MDRAELVKLIAQYIKKNAWKESIFETSDPHWHVEVTALMDYISEVTGISKEQIGEWVDNG